MIRIWYYGLRINFSDKEGNLSEKFNFYKYFYDELGKISSLYFDISADEVFSNPPEVKIMIPTIDPNDPSIKFYVKNGDVIWEDRTTTKEDALISIKAWIHNELGRKIKVYSKVREEIDNIYKGL